jgi:hypothetical protein
MVSTRRLGRRKGETFKSSDRPVTTEWFNKFSTLTALGMGWVAAFEVDPEKLGGLSHSWLTLISLLSLFLEMLMIRRISSEIRIFAYFKNLVLVACFLGFGLGCYLCRRRILTTRSVRATLTSCASPKPIPSDHITCSGSYVFKRGRVTQADS